MSVLPGRGLRRAAGIILLTIFIDMVGFGIVIPVLPLYAERFGATPVQIGWLVGIYSAAQFLFAPVLGRLSDRYGRRPVLLASVAGTAAGFLLMGAADTLWLLFVARAFDGMTGGNISTAQAYLADITRPESRAKAMGLIGAAFGVGFIFGPFIGGVLSRIAMPVPFLFAGGLAVVNAGLIAWRLPESLPPERRRGRARAGGPVAAPPPAAAGVGEGQPPDAGPGMLLYALLAVYFLAITGFAIMTTLFALFAQYRHGFDAAETGLLLALMGLIGVIVQGGLIGRLARRFGELPLAAAGAALLALGLLAMPLAAAVAGLVAATCGVALGNSLLTPSLNAAASRSVGGDWQGRALGLMQSAGSLGRTVGPVAAGALLALDVDKELAFYGRTPLWTGAALLAAACLMLVVLVSCHPNRLPFSSQPSGP